MSNKDKLTELNAEYVNLQRDIFSSIELFGVREKGLKDLCDRVRHHEKQGEEGVPSLVGQERVVAANAIIQMRILVMKAQRMQEIQKEIEKGGER